MTKRILKLKKTVTTSGFHLHPPFVLENREQNKLQILAKKILCFRLESFGGGNTYFQTPPDRPTPRAVRCVP